MRVVVDTNVLVSGLLTPFNPPGVIVGLIAAIAAHSARSAPGIRSTHPLEISIGSALRRVVAKSHLLLNPDTALSPDRYHCELIEYPHHGCSPHDTAGPKRHHELPVASGRRACFNPLHPRSPRPFPTSGTALKRPRFTGSSRPSSLENDRLMASFERNPGKPVRATFNLFATSKSQSAPVGTDSNRAPRYPIVLTSKHVSDGYSSYARSSLGRLNRIACVVLVRLADITRTGTSSGHAREWQNLLGDSFVHG